ncbi:D-serine ammonia-lyase [Pseudomonas veronii]|uniref:D-serine ammonia-lyase n=1 Tax=Pseudomonas veronii TaxID=76761 RepID=UPI0021C204F9|nr:D-serine ammonia-lyase [Pseudomonas veronii]MCT9827740.1 D-serine ammonia-lyase [Pseudomonas veronii]
MTDKKIVSEDTMTALHQRNPFLWINPDRAKSGEPGKLWHDRVIGKSDIHKTYKRFVRFSNVLKTLFPELEGTDGFIDSALLPADTLQSALGLAKNNGSLFIKADHSLPVAGSIKARGGIHEVLEFAERIALENNLITVDTPDDITNPDSRKLLSKYKVSVGSTGNLGLSIGIIASALGFEATVHMSADAKEWKKQRLRDRGVNVVEHDGDYAAAVAAGRTAAEKDPFCHFVDDESSFSLFAGYSAAALRLKEQLDEKSITINKDNPLFVYIPCGVGGAPGGIAFGLAHTFGSNVHCFFAEPTASACFMVAMMDRSGTNPSVYDVGLDNRTEADGLAVPKASECAVNVMRPTLSGIFTVEDDTLFRHVHTAAVTEEIRIEPSAAAAFDGPRWLTKTPVGEGYLRRHDLQQHMVNATHIIWTTGGLFVPEVEYQRFLTRGSKIKS